jgi:hypothetical protein
MELVKKGEENSGCKITLFQYLNSVVNSEKKYTGLWAVKTKSGNIKIQKTRLPVKKEEDGWIFFSGSKITGDNSSTESFYTLCDGSITAIILTEAQGSVCINEINSILASINIPVTGTNSKTRAKTKKTKFPYVYRAVYSN